LGTKFVKRIIGEGEVNCYLNILGSYTFVNSRGLDLKIGGELYSGSLGDAQSGHDSFITTFHNNIDTIDKNNNEKKKKNVLEIEDLTVAYAENPVLWDVDLNIPEGQLVAIVGPNGAGKTTLIKAALGLVPRISGRIRFFPSDGEKPATDIAYVPQSESVDWDFPATVLDVVLMGRYGHLGWIRRPRSEDYEIARDMLRKVGMMDYSARQISQLSGGQQQRVFLARALAQQADLYLMDEPFKGVDARTELAIVDLLRNIQNQGKTVVAVHHDLQTVKEYFNWVVLLNIQVIASGPMRDTFSEENIRLTYRRNKPAKKEG
jgi:manganese/zinc/iron transport system ATP- binding protein